MRIDSTLIVGSEKTIDKETSSFVDELQGSAEYQVPLECDNQVQVELGMAFATPSHRNERGD